MTVLMGCHCQQPCQWRTMCGSCTFVRRHQTSRCGEEGFARDLGDGLSS